MRLPRFSPFPPATTLISTILSFALSTGLLAGLDQAGAKTFFPAASENAGQSEVLAPSDPVQISSGHVDIGPLMVDGALRLLARDDTAASPLWRDLNATVFRVNDLAAQDIVQTPDFAFLSGAKRAHIIEQTQRPGVLWLGWNTMARSLLSTELRGVNYTMTGFSGPGHLAVFLQNGNFSPPEVLWDSSKKMAQSVWVEPNTHTHANWVFTAPGVYLMQMQVSATTTGNQVFSDTQLLRFAVGEGADAQKALKAVLNKTDLLPATPSTASPEEVSETSETNSAGTASNTGGANNMSASNANTQNPGEGQTDYSLYLAIIALGALLLLVFVFYSLKRRRQEMLSAQAAWAGAHYPQTPGGKPEMPGPNTYPAEQTSPNLNPEANQRPKNLAKEEQ